MLCVAGIKQLRYPVPWHRIEQEPGKWDWSWMDGPVDWMRRNGMRPILDPLHHVSFPHWLESGFANAEFPMLYARFVQQVVRRYDWVQQYTVFNEPLPTLILCSQTGDWYPNRRTDADFVLMAANAVRAISLATRELRSVNPSVELVHIDSCEHHRALDAESEELVRFVNERRFLFHDLILGRVGKDHPMHEYLQRHGFGNELLGQLRNEPAPFDVLGLDYYAHSEMDWGHNAVQFPCRRALGFAEVGRQYVERFQCPVMLTETNVGGTVQDRVTWLRCMEEQTEQLSEMADVRGFCWFPAIDATDWNTLCTQANLTLSPMGVWSLDDEREVRHTTELSDWYGKLARGEARWRDMPIYPPDPPLDRDLAGFFHLPGFKE